MTSLKLAMMSCSVMALSLLLKLRKSLAPCKFPSRETCFTASLPRLLDVEGDAIAAPMDSFIFGAGSATPAPHWSYVEGAGLWTGCCSTPAPLG